MDLYRKKLQVKLYALEYGIFFKDHYYGLLQHTKFLSFQEFQRIRLPIDDDFLFFLNEGLVAGTLDDNLDSDWYRLILEREVFGDFGQLTGIEIPRFYWFAITKVELMAIPLNILIHVLNDETKSLEKLVKHLSSVETKRMHFLNHLSKLPPIQKMDFFESEAPELLLKTRNVFLPKFLGISRETLNRALKEKNYQPNII